MSESVKVLLVDDAPKNLAALQKMLKRPGIELLPAASGAAAIELLLDHEVALVLIDSDMPGMDGYQLAELLRASQRTADTPILLITEPGEDTQRVFRFLDGGAVDFLNRPLEAHVLRGKVETFVKLQSSKLQLTRQLENVQQSLKLNEMFAAVLGHDLRSPLSAIMVSAELVIVRNKDADDVAAALRIRDSAKRMSHLISQLIDMARVRSGHVNLSLAPADFAAVCKDVVGEVESQHQSRIKVEIRGDTQGVWDPHRLAQILSNLVGNAVKHGESSKPIQVRIDGTQTNQVLCSVQNGGEIGAKQLPHIFKPFRGFDGTGDRRAGLGLGLYIVQQLVAMHGGDINVSSSAAEGTVFKVVMKRNTSLLDSAANAKTLAP